ncbi:hypothetical protein [Kovacikia minuta]|nr:hypothetical protein [Kovacikia minuta]
MRYAKLTHPTRGAIALIDTAAHQAEVEGHEVGQEAVFAVGDAAKST